MVMSSTSTSRPRSAPAATRASATIPDCVVASMEPRVPRRMCTSVLIKRWAAGRGDDRGGGATNHDDAEDGPNPWVGTGVGDWLHKQTGARRGGVRHLRERHAGI